MLRRHGDECKIMSVSQGGFGCVSFQTSSLWGWCTWDLKEGEAKGQRKSSEAQQSARQDWTFKHGGRRKSARGNQRCEKYHTSVCHLPGSECPQIMLLRLCMSACLWGCCARVNWNALSLAMMGYCCLNYLFITPCTPVISHRCIREMDGKVLQNSGSQGFPRHQNVKNQIADLKRKAHRLFSHQLHRQAGLPSKKSEKSENINIQSWAHFEIKAIVKIWHRVIFGGLRNQKGWQRWIWSIL